MILFDYTANKILSCQLFCGWWGAQVIRHSVLSHDPRHVYNQVLALELYVYIKF